MQPRVRTLSRLIGLAGVLLWLGACAGMAEINAPSDGVPIGARFPTPPATVTTPDEAVRDLALLLSDTNHTPGIKYTNPGVAAGIDGEPSLRALLGRPTADQGVYWYSDQTLHNLVYVALPQIAVLPDRIEISPKITVPFASLPEYDLTIEKTGDRPDTRRYHYSVAAFGTNPRPYRIRLGETAFLFAFLADAQRCAGDLRVLQQAAEAKTTPLGTAFVAKAAEYRALKVKPPVSEDQRKAIVQANALAEKKEYERAIERYQAALDLDPVAYPTAYYNLALLTAQTGRYKAAIAYMRQYLQLEPEASDARKAQDKIYEWELMVK